jgi:hypothetical protein
VSQLWLAHEHVWSTQHLPKLRQRAFSSVAQMMSENRLSAYLNALWPHLWWYLTCGPLAVEELFDPVLRIYGIDIDRYIARGRVTPLLILLAFLGVFYSGFLAWRDADSARRQGSKQLEDLTRPQFIADITKVSVERFQARTDLIRLLVHITIRNLGVESSIGGWQLKVVPPQPATPYLQTADGWLNREERDGNLLNLTTVIRKNEIILGWLLCQGPSDQLGLHAGQGPAVQVLFKDAYDRTYSPVYPPNFKSDFFS